MMATINLVREGENTEKNRRMMESEREKQAAQGKRKVLDGKLPSTRDAGEQRMNNRRD
jgi:hypothetical protein